MMRLPLPAIVADKGNGTILYANEAAQASGLTQSQRFDVTPANAVSTAQDKSVSFTAEGRTLRAQFRETEVNYDGQGSAFDRLFCAV